jgi:hypothetical protein
MLIYTDSRSPCLPIYRPGRRKEARVCLRAMASDTQEKANWQTASCANVHEIQGHYGRKRSSCDLVQYHGQPGSFVYGRSRILKLAYASLINLPHSTQATLWQDSGAIFTAEFSRISSASRNLRSQDRVDHQRLGRRIESAIDPHKFDKANALCRPSKKSTSKHTSIFKRIMWGNKRTVELVVF